jgi:hypothetical protein
MENKDIEGKDFIRNNNIEEKWQEIPEVFRSVFNESQRLKKEVDDGKLQQKEATRTLLDFIDQIPEVKDYIPYGVNSVFASAWSQSQPEDYIETIKKKLEKFGR